MSLSLHFSEFTYYVINLTQSAQSGHIASQLDCYGIGKSWIGEWHRKNFTYSLYQFGLASTCAVFETLLPVYFYHTASSAVALM